MTKSTMDSFLDMFLAMLRGEASYDFGTAAAAPNPIDAMLTVSLKLQRRSADATFRESIEAVCVGDGCSGKADECPRDHECPAAAIRARMATFVEYNEAIDRRRQHLAEDRQKPDDPTSN